MAATGVEEAPLLDELLASEAELATELDDDEGGTVVNSVMVDRGVVVVVLLELGVVVVLEVV